MQLTFPTRFWRYLVERFSLYTILPASLIQYFFITHYAGGIPQPADWSVWAIGFLTYVGVFLILRLSDDLKDKEHDDRFYAARPVQRGLISVRELTGALASLIAVLTVANLLWSTAPAVALYFLTLVFLGLMRFEFFMSAYLKPRLLLYLAFHQLFVCLLVAYVIYHHGAEVRGPADVLFLALNLLMVMSIEVARKIRPTALDHTGRDTYSAYLGRSGALVFLGLILVAAQYLFNAIAGAPLWIGLLLLLPLAAAVYYLRSDSRSGAQALLGATLALLTGNMLAVMR